MQSTREGMHTEVSNLVEYDYITDDDNNEPYPIPVQLSLTGISLVLSDGATIVSEGGAVDSISVVLDAAPDSTVTLSVVSEFPDEVTADPETLSFDATNCDSPVFV